MNIKHFCFALGLSVTLFDMTSCNFSPETKEQIAQYRDNLQCATK